MSKCTCQIVPTGDMALGRPDFRIERCTTCVENEKIADAARLMVIAEEQLTKRELERENIDVRFNRPAYNKKQEECEAALTVRCRAGNEFWQLARQSLAPDQSQGEPNA